MYDNIILRSPLEILKDQISTIEKTISIHKEAVHNHNMRVLQCEKSLTELNESVDTIVERLDKEAADRNYIRVMMPVIPYDPDPMLDDELIIKKEISKRGKK